MFFGSGRSTQSPPVQFSIKVEGLKEAIGILEKVPQKMARKFVKKAMSKSLNSLLRQAQANAPVGRTGNLKKSLKKQITLSKNTRGWLWGGVYAAQGGSGKNKKGTGDNLGAHAYWIEFGWKLTKANKAKGTKSVIRFIPGQRFMTRALQAQAPTIIDNFAQNVVEMAREAEAALNKGASLPND